MPESSRWRRRGRLSGTRGTFSGDAENKRSGNTSGRRDDGQPGLRVAILSISKRTHPGGRRFNPCAGHGLHFFKWNSERLEILARRLTATPAC
jgi:hypothetical protein